MAWDDIHIFDADKNVPGGLWCGIRNRLGSFYTNRVEYHRMEGEGGDEMRCKLNYWINWGEKEKLFMEASYS